MALIADRNTPRRYWELYQDPVAASTKIFAGSLVVLNATGYAAPGSTATGLVARGLAEEQIDNSAGADGDLSINIRSGCFQFKNDASINRTHIGGTAYIVDDETLAATDGTGTRSAAGTIKDVDSDGVWIQVG